jgi:hypothetical protein
MKEQQDFKVNPFLLFIVTTRNYSPIVAIIENGRDEHFFGTIVFAILKRQWQ